MEQIKYEVTENETFYFYVRLVISIAIYAGLGYTFFAHGVSKLGDILIFYAILILLYFFFSFGLLVGYIEGNAIKVTKKQFPDVYSIIESHCEKLGMATVPATYIMQSGGVLNAFATRFIGRDFVVIYSEIFELAYAQGQDALEFVIGHELGHVKRKHMSKHVLLFPSLIIPFLGSAYSRACEYTCDNIGKALNANGGKDGLLILAAGKELYKKVNMEEYINEERNEDSFWKWFSEKTSSHPNLPKRIDRMK
ncbi:MAG TPA: M48 family metallopeptidase [Bacteroidia bacterium]|nr:M48 family metallopeptidase [Bacteroidia bacterium]